MEMMVPVWAGANPANYVYLYSEFGGKGVVGGRNYGHSDGFEEWAVRQGPGGTYVIPEPASLIVWSLLGAVGIAIGWRRRKAA
jgi:hypothetical protein